MVFVELQVPGPGPSPQLLAAQVRDLAVVDVEALDLVLAEVGHQEHPPGRLPVDLVEVRPALPVSQVLPPVRPRAEIARLGSHWSNHYCALIGRELHSDEIFS